MDNYPPGVTGNEPQITGLWPVDPHNPFWAEFTPEQHIVDPHEFMGTGNGVYFGNEESPRSTHPTYKTAQAVAHYLNVAIGPCRFPGGRFTCVICGEPHPGAF